MLSSFKTWCIERLGGFADVESALDSIADGRTRDYVLTRAVKKLFNTIGEEDILKVHESGQWQFQGRILGKAEKDLLIAEATNFMDTLLWRVLQADVKYQANRKMFLKAESDLDLIAGKLWVYTLDTFNTRLKSMRAGHAILNSGQK